MSNIEKIKSLVEKLNEWAYSYYTLDKPVVSDAEYDRNYDELLKLEEETGIILSNSPTQKVGDLLLEKFEKHTHISRLYSLDKSQDYEGIKEFDNRNKRTLNIDKIEYVVELKFDGLTVNLTYENKKLIGAATRGTGLVGEDITEQVKRIKGIPFSIQDPGTFEITGEAYMPISSFTKYNIDYPDEKLKNPRNAAAGAVRNLNTSTITKRNIQTYFYQINTHPEGMFETDVEIKNFLKNNGFDVNNNYYICSSIDEVIEKIKVITKMRSTLDYMIDGVVIKVNNLKFREILGHTNKFPRWAIAYKFEAEERYTKLIDVIWNVGRTSKVTPSAVLEPVEIDGVTISRATLNNYNYIESKNIKINSEVLIRRSNDVIPEIISANNDFSNTVDIQKPTKCPACDSELEEIGAHLFCPNTLSCKPQLIAKLTHFVSKNAMNIEGLSEKTIAQLIRIHNITKISDFYTLSKEDLAQLEGFKEKKINNTLNSIENSKTVKFNNFINALGIPNVGEKTAFDLSNQFDSFEELINSTEEELNNLEDIGPITAKGIYSFFKNESVLNILKEIFELGIEIKYNNKIDNLSLKDLTFVITGTFSNYKRSTLEESIKLKGGKVTGTVSRNTNYLLVGDKPGSKLDKAKELGVEIITEDNIEKIIGG